MADAIDRQEAIDTIMEDYQPDSFPDEYSDGYNEGLKSAKKSIESLPPAQQWIPCSERLPEDETVVLVCTEDEFMYLAERTCGNWEEITGFCSVNDTVAWMPLPEPYKGE